MRTIIPLVAAGMVVLISCAVQNADMQGSTIDNGNSLQGRYSTLRQENASFGVNLIPPQNGAAFWEGKQLDDPYGVRVEQGKTYQVEIDMQDGTPYKGTVQVVGAGGSVGRFQGYDVRLSGYIIEMLKHDRQVSYYLNSPGGRQVLLVTFFAP